MSLPTVTERYKRAYISAGTPLALPPVSPRMETCCRCLLLLGILAAAATAVPSQHKTLSYEEAVALAVDFYNQGSGIDHAFRLLKANPQPEWDMTSNPQQKLKFTVKETVCLVSENRHGTECDFIDNGVVRDCSGSFSTQQESPIVIISCNTVTQEDTHIRRARSPRRRRRRPHWHLPGSYTLISHGGGGGKGRGSRLQVA